MVFIQTFAIFLAASADALTVSRASHANSSVRSTQAAPFTFPSFYAQHKGRGIWKWNNALDVYQRHIADLSGKPLSIAEVGVQSGGSMLMWQAVLGNQITLHGLDINPACKKFIAKGVDITIGDQGSKAMWDAFYAKGVYLDILVDDGGHQAHQVLQTLLSTFPHIHPGGYHIIEDIPSSHLWGFFNAAAPFLAGQAGSGKLESVHLYPYMMVVHKGGFAADSPQAKQGQLQFTTAKTDVTDFLTMWTAINTVAPGTHIVLRNPKWTNLFEADSLMNFFQNFITLHGESFVDTPLGCAITTASVCTNAASPNTHTQNRVSGVHIYKDHAVIEVPATPPWIAAVRKGTEWLSYA